MSETPRTGRLPVAARRRGIRGWADVRGRHVGAAAFLMNRVSGLLLVGYLYLHLGVLFLLTRGPGSWSSVVALFKNPYFRGLESLLILAILVHALNGLRLALVGSGVGVSHQKVLFVAAMSVTAVLIAAAAIAMFTVG